MASALERAARAAYEAAEWIDPEVALNVARAVLMAVLSDMQRYEPDGDNYGWFGMSKDASGEYIDISGLLEELKDTTND